MSIASDIILGAHDAELDAITAALSDRKDTIAKARLVDIAPGDTVRFSDIIRPKYLVGKTATVKKINRESIVVDCPLDPAYGRYNGAQNVRCPKALIAGAA